MRDYASALKDSLRDVVEVQEKVDAYNERQTDSAYKLHIGDDGGIYTSFGYRISYDYHDTTRNVMHYYTEREDGNTYMQIDAANILLQRIRKQDNDRCQQWTYSRLFECPANWKRGRR